MGSAFLEAKDGLNWQEPSTSRRKGKHSSGEAAHLRKGQAVGGRNEIGVFLGREARTCRGVSCRGNESIYREQRNGLLLEAMHARVTRSNTWVFLPHRCIESTRDTRLRARSLFAGSTQVYRKPAISIHPSARAAQPCGVPEGPSTAVRQGDGERVQGDAKVSSLEYFGGEGTRATHRRDWQHNLRAQACQLGCARRLTLLVGGRWARGQPISSTARRRGMGSSGLLPK